MSAKHAQVERLIRAARFNEAAALCNHILAESPNDLKVLPLLDFVHNCAPQLARRRAHVQNAEAPAINPPPKCGWGGKRPGAGRKQGDGPSKRSSSSKYARPIPDPRELKRWADAELREVEIRKQLDRIEKVLRERRRWFHHLPRNRDENVIVPRLNKDRI
jgi:hypothetical protein